mmetsp:Transcript_45693/g.138842  ORF Transcript_45693/g.138842 Transcript_45693/m.138842 type:complete len:248 (+) Transcript_45693:1124-1867(+)
MRVVRLCFLNWPIILHRMSSVRLTLFLMLHIAIIFFIMPAPTVSVTAPSIVIVEVWLVPSLIPTIIDLGFDALFPPRPVHACNLRASSSSWGRRRRRRHILVSHVVCERVKVVMILRRRHGRVAPNCLGILCLPYFLPLECGAAVQSIREIVDFLQNSLRLVQVMALTTTVTTLAGRSRSHTAPVRPIMRRRELPPHDVSAAHDHVLFRATTRRRAVVRATVGPAAAVAVAVAEVGLAVLFHLVHLP